MKIPNRKSLAKREAYWRVIGLEFKKKHANGELRYKDSLAYESSGRRRYASKFWECKTKATLAGKHIAEKKEKRIKDYEEFLKNKKDGGGT